MGEHDDADHDDDGNHRADRDEATRAKTPLRLRCLTARAARHGARPCAGARRLRAARIFPAGGSPPVPRVPGLTGAPRSLVGAAGRAAATLRGEEVLERRIHPGDHVAVPAIKARRLLRTTTLLTGEVLALIVLRGEAGTRCLARVILAAEVLLAEVLLAEA